MSFKIHVTSSMKLLVLTVLQSDMFLWLLLTLQKEEMSTLKSLYLNRCQSGKDAFQGVRAWTTETTSYYNGRTHKDTIVLEWNSVRLKESVVSERLTFE